MTALPPPREAHRPRDLGDGADLGVLALVHGHEEDALGLADLDRQRHRHVREDHAVLERDQEQIRHVCISFNRHTYFND